MSDTQTLSTLTRLSRKPVVVRELQCPECDSAVKLESSRLHCRTCLSEYDQLAELAVGDVIERRGT